jgi:multimeric flavodoxin WrbA
MKTLILNGSPRKDGDTVALITKLQELLHGETTVINTYDAAVQPCTDCRYCWVNPACVLQDEMQSIIKAIDKADNIILASPIYFSELSGSLLQFASRLQYLWVSKNIRHETVLCDKPRKGYVVLVGGGDGSTDTALKTAKCLLKHMGAAYVECVCSHNTNVIPAKDDTVALNKIREIAERINAQCN